MSQKFVRLTIGFITVLAIADCAGPNDIASSDLSSTAAVSVSGSSAQKVLADASAQVSSATSANPSDAQTLELTIQALAQALQDVQSLNLAGQPALLAQQQQLILDLTNVITQLGTVLLALQNNQTGLPRTPPPSQPGGWGGTPPLNGCPVGYPYFILGRTFPYGCCGPAGCYTGH